MSPRIIAIVALLTLSVAGSAMADQGNDYSRSHWYVGGGFGGASDFLEADVEAKFTGLDIETGWSANVRVGYRWLSWLAIEGMYEGAYDLDATATDTILGPGRVDVFRFDMHTLMGNLKFILPLRRFEPYFMLGFGAQTANFKDLLGAFDENRWDFALRPATGLDFYFNENWSINAELAVTLRATDYGRLGSHSTDNATLTYGLGAAYHF